MERDGESGEGGTRPGVRREGEEGQAHGGTQKLTRERALCAVSEPEASPYCVSPRVAFVSALVAPIVFCPHTRPFCFAASSLSRISLEPRPRKREASLSTDKGNRCVPSSRATPLLPIARSLPSLRPFVARDEILILRGGHFHFIHSFSGSIFLARNFSKNFSKTHFSARL